MNRTIQIATATIVIAALLLAGMVYLEKTFEKSRVAERMAKNSASERIAAQKKAWLAKDAVFYDYWKRCCELELHAPTATLEEVFKTLRLVAPTNYVRFKSGNVLSLSRHAFEKAGLAYPPLNPSTNLDGEVAILGKIRVAEKAGSGCVMIGEEGRKLFLEGFEGFPDRDYGPCLAVKCVSGFSYDSVLGVKKVIPRYEYGKPVPKAEFQEYLKSRLIYKADL
jgi:hypothetical protein